MASEKPSGNGAAVFGGGAIVGGLGGLIGLGGAEFRPPLLWRAQFCDDAHVIFSLEMINRVQV